MRKIRKGDSVVVTTGRDKGKRGEVTRVVDAEHVVVAGVNQQKRHTRPNPMKNQPGGNVTKDAPIHVSNVAIWNPSAGKEQRSLCPPPHRNTNRPPLTKSMNT